MGCLNSDQKQPDWKAFSNIHLSGPCNRSCYFCIGQHMMTLDPFNNLDEWPLKNLDVFVDRCNERGIKEVNVTGSNTDPLLYKHTSELAAYLREHIPGVKLGIRTNGALIAKHPELWALYDKASISLTSLDEDLYKKTMGQGRPPNLITIRSLDWTKPIKINVVLCPETVESGDVYATLLALQELGFKTVNLREPYGQPHIGDPMTMAGRFRYGIPGYRFGDQFGMPVYFLNRGLKVVYWDVHYVEVESVNLYANGVVSEDYPVTRGHDPVAGKVEDQSHFTKSGRVHEQWLTTKSAV